MKRWVPWMPGTEVATASSRDKNVAPIYVPLKPAFSSYERDGP